MRAILPHDGVLVRLGLSKIHGIGVFAQQWIEAGINVFENDQAELSWVPRSVLEATPLASFQRAFYEDFAIRRGDHLGCPANFNLLTAGWYVNEPAAGEEPNLAVVSGYQLVASRDIAKGEELTVRYSDFENM